MKKYLFSFVFSFCVLTIFAQVSFEKTFDFENVSEFGAELLQTSDNGYVITGGTDGKALLMKTDQYGELVWQFVYDEGYGSYSSSVYQCSDNGFVMAGLAGTSSGSGSDAYLLKIDASGNKTWAKTFDFEESDRINDVVQTNDGGFLFVGEAGFAGFIVRTNSTGNIVWQNLYEASMYHWQFLEIAKTVDGQYVIVGSENSASTSGYEVNLIKMDDSGNETWNYTYTAGYGYSVKQTSDNGFIVSGNNGAVNGVYVLKTNSLGIETWSESYFTGTEEACGYGITETSGGGYAVLFHYISWDPPYGGNGILKINSTGIEEWNRTYWLNIDPWCGHIIETSDMGFAVTGKYIEYDEFGSEINRDVYLLKTLNDGSGCFMYVTDVQDICMVTVDNTGQYNKIIWEPIIDLDVNGYNVYKQSTEGDALIGYVPVSQLSEFVDTTSNPAAYSDKYKLSIVDTCDNEVGFGDYHKTIHLNVSPATPVGFALTWEHYEGFTYSKYRIFRGTTPGNMVQIDSIISSNFTYTDETTLSGTLYYRIAAVKPDACYSSSAAKDVGGPYSQSVSNLEDNIMGEGIEDICEDEFKLKLFPNPCLGQTNISYELNSPQYVKMTLYNVSGEEIKYFENSMKATGKHNCNLEMNMKSGVYFLKVVIGDSFFVKEVVVKN